MDDGKLSRVFLKSHSGEFDLESILYLNLKRQEISDVGCIGECSCLTRLDLSENGLTKLLGLSSLLQLTYLNLSANFLQSIEGLQTLDNLEYLNVAGNLILSFDVLKTLSDLSKLSRLRLQDRSYSLFNPICKNEVYKPKVLSILPNLSVLDGERVKGAGSELFEICDKIDTVLAERVERDTDVESKVEQASSPWIPDGFWKTDTSEFDKSNLHDAEEQLKTLLLTCKIVRDKATAKLKEAAQK